MHLDLHLHSTCSDGALAPEALAPAAHRAGLHAIALTDHDTTAGIARLAAAAVPLGLLVISAIELSCRAAGRDLHLLGYGIDPDHPALAGVTARLTELRRERLAEIVARLRALGVGIATGDVAAPAGNVSIGRPHVAAALVRLGAVGSVQEAFTRYLRDGGPAYVPAAGPDVADGIAAVHAAGGLAVWAHPDASDVIRFGALAAQGLDGVEALRPNVAPTASAAIEHAGREAGLLVTGGSDWHGAPPALGAFYVTDRHVGALLERLGIDARQGGPR